jgi:hypothetical protein
LTSRIAYGYFDSTKLTALHAAGGFFGHTIVTYLAAVRLQPSTRGYEADELYRHIVDNRLADLDVTVSAPAVPVNAWQRDAVPWWYGRDGNAFFTRAFGRAVPSGVSASPIFTPAGVSPTDPVPLAAPRLPVWFLVFTNTSVRDVLRLLSTSPAADAAVFSATIDGADPCAVLVPDALRTWSAPFQTWIKRTSDDDVLTFHQKRSMNPFNDIVATIRGAEARINHSQNIA